MAMTDADKRAWTQLLDEIAATIQTWRQHREYVEQLVLYRQHRPIGTAMDVTQPYDYPFDLCDMKKLKAECYATIDAMIAMKETELKEKTEAFHKLLKKGGK